MYSLLHAILMYGGFYDTVVALLVGKKEKKTNIIDMKENG